MLSQILVKGFVLEYKPNLVRRFTKMVDDNQNRIFYFMIFLRVTPLIPNWFVNLSSPIAGIPVSKFYIGTFIGLMPFNYIHIKTGMMLNDMTKFGVSFNQLLILAGISVLLLLPTLLTKGKTIDDADIDAKDK